MPHLPGIYVGRGNLNSGPHNKRQGFCPQSHHPRLSFFKVSSARLRVFRTSLTHLSACTHFGYHQRFVVVSAIALVSAYVPAFSSLGCVHRSRLQNGERPDCYLLEELSPHSTLLQLCSHFRQLLSPPGAHLTLSVAGSACASGCAAVSHGHFPSGELS